MSRPRTFDATKEKRVQVPLPKKTARRLEDTAREKGIAAGREAAIRIAYTFQLDDAREGLDKKPLPISWLAHPNKPDQPPLRRVLRKSHAATETAARRRTPRKK